MTQYFKEHAASLVSSGYDVIQIYPNSKNPIGKEWQNRGVSPEQIKRICSNGGANSSVGILTKRTPAIDLDIYDQDVSETLCQFISDLFDNQSPCRVGQAPKSLFLFRTLEPFSKRLSTRYVDIFGDVHQVEVLGEGQQFVTFGVHPDTRKEYTWDSPIPIKKELPVLDQEDIDLVFAKFDELAIEAGWEPHRSSRSNQPVLSDDADILLGVKEVLDIDDDEARDILLRIPNDDKHYDEWVKIGMALHHQFKGHDEGFKLWEEWSSLSDKHDPDMMAYKWSSFGDLNKGNPVTFGSIMHWAKESDLVNREEAVGQLIEKIFKADDWLDIQLNVLKECRSPKFNDIEREEIVGAIQRAYKNFKGVTLPKPKARDLVKPDIANFDEPEWLEPWIWIHNQERFYNMWNRAWRTKTSFNASYNRKLKQLMPVVGMGTAAEIVLDHYEVGTYENILYRPTLPTFFKENGQEFANSYIPNDINIPEQLNQEERETVESFSMHVKNLIPDPRDRQLFVDYLAYTVQNPGDKIKYSVLLQGTEGDGKTYFAETMAAILGGENVNIINAEILEEKYNSWAANASMVFVEEIRIQGHNRFAILNKLKPVHTNDVVSIRDMYASPYKTRNTCNYMMFTNFKDALPLDENDSRYFIIFSRFQSKPEIDAFEAANPGYFDKLYGLMYENPGAIARYLLDWEISEEFSPKKRAPSTVDKQLMINANKSEDCEDMKGFIAECYDLDICDDLLNLTKLQTLYDEKSFDDDGPDFDFPSTKTLNLVLKKLGFTYLERIKYDGKMCRFYSKNPTKIKSLKGRNLGARIRKFLE